MSPLATRPTTCRGLGCTETNLIDAHIMPRGFARDMMGAGFTHNIQASLEFARPTQHGLYDRTILCSSCDGTLGAFDDLALEVSRDFAVRHIAVRLFGFDCFIMPNVDGDMFAKFALAVLWRGSISSRPEFKKIRLGPYEDRARDVLFGASPLSDLKEYELLVMRIRETSKFQTRFIYSFPDFDNLAGINRWGFVAGGFRFVCKMDKRPWSGISPEYLKEAAVNGKDRLFGMFIDYEETSEHRGAVQMRHADISRRTARRKR